MRQAAPREAFLQAPPRNTLTALESLDLLSDRELLSTNKDASALLQMMATRQASAVEVVTAFSKRAALAQQLIRCCTEMFFDEALEAAKELVRYLETTGKVKGPLHGLPVSLKDHY
jgi:amidase